MKKLNFWFLLLLGLSFLLVACGGGDRAGRVEPTANSTLTSPVLTVGSDVPTLEILPSDPLLVVATNGPSFTPVGLPTARPVAPATKAAIVDANLKTELVIWEALSTKQTSLVKDQVTNFGKLYPSLKVTTLHFDTGELLWSLEQATKSASLPDLIFAPSDYTLDLTNLKALQSADKVFDKSFLASFATNALNGSNLNGTQWGVPFTYSGTSVMLYNKKLVPTAPASWDELAKVVTPLYDQKTKALGLAIDINEPYILTSLVGGFGGTLLDAKGQPALDTPAMRSSLDFIAALVKDKTVRAESTARDNQIEYAFRDGRLGVYIVGDWAIGSYASAINATEVDSKLDLGIAPLPKINQTDKYPRPLNYSKTIFVGAQAQGERLKAIKTYLEWIAKPEQQAAILNKTNLLPASKAFLVSDTVKNNAVWNGLYFQLELGQAASPSIEMRAASEALRPALQAFSVGTLKAAQASQQMQRTALETLAKLSVSK